MTTLTVTRDRSAGDYALRGAMGGQTASLHVDRRLRAGRITTASGTWPVRRAGRRKVVAGDGGQPLVRLSGGLAVVPGPGNDAHWSVGRRWGAPHRATLRQGEASIDLCLSGLNGRRCEVQISGDFEQRDLVVLAACFALLVRRRQFMVAAGSS